MHQAEVVQYARPEIIGLVFGGIYYLCSNERVSFYGRFFPDDPFYPGEW